MFRVTVARVAIAIALISWPAAALAQALDVGITGLGLVSVQPIDEAYVGGPYLSEGIGGTGPGFGAAISAITPGGLVIMAEFTRAWFEQLQSGRLVPGGTSPVGGSATTRLHDAILSSLIGQAVTAGRTRIQFVAGAGVVLDSPTIDGDDIYEFGMDEPSRFVLTGGIDLIHPAGSSAALVVNARYSHIGRPEQAQYLGIGPHIFRFGGGIRVRLN